MTFNHTHSNDQQSDCTCYINNQRCHVTQLSLRTMNFSQPWRTCDLNEVNYRVYLPKTFVNNFLKRELAAYIEDAKQHPDFNDLLENQLRNLQWPSSKDLFEDNDLAILILEYFGHDILLAWFGDGPPRQNPGFVINTIEKAELIDNHPCFSGKARTTDQKVVYQDI